MKYDKTKKIIISVLIAFLIVVLDQLTKFHIVTSMIPYSDEKKVLSDLLVLKYIKNTGAAWGSFSSMTTVLIVVSVILIVGLGYYYFKIINDENKKLIRLLVTFVVGGAIGNLIDRIRFGYVIDFIYVKCINFPVFNVADIFVTVSMFLIIFIILFSKDDNEPVKENETEKNSDSKQESIKDSIQESKKEAEKDSIQESKKEPKKVSIKDSIKALKEKESDEDEDSDAEAYDDLEDEDL